MAEHFLVAGASGFVGSNLMERLAKKNVAITGTYYKNKPKKLYPNVTYEKLDLTDPDSAGRICHGKSRVYMCAAVSSGASVIASNPMAHFTPNILMNTNMLNAAYEKNIKKYCFISSSVVYPDSAETMREDDATFEFFNRYHAVAWMKRFAEISCEIYGKWAPLPMTTIVVRPSNLYGPHDKFDVEKAKVIPSLVRKSLTNKNLEVWGDGSELKDFLYISDFIDGLVKAVDHYDGHQVVNICSGKEITIMEVAKIIKSYAMSEEAMIVLKKDMPSMISARKMSHAKLNLDLGWKPETNIDIGIKKTVDWLKNQFSQE